MESGLEAVWRDWKVVRLLGEGSFGKVYEIERNQFGIIERSAVKMISIPASLAEMQSLHNDGMTERDIETYYTGVVQEFAQEISLMSKLRGQAHIVSYEDYAVIERTDRFGWDIYIRMELLTSLPAHMDALKADDPDKTVAVSGDQKTAFGVDDVVAMATDICSALEVCYEHRIVHRDIKPDNVFVAADGSYKLGDFGVAKTVEKTVSGLSKKGTYTYMAPEIYKGEPGGMNADLYSLGIMMYKLLNDNREPFLPPVTQGVSFADKQQALVRRMNGEMFPPPKHGGEALWTIVKKACESNPKKRYQSPTDMKRDLQWFLKGDKVTTRSAPVATAKRSVEKASKPTAATRTALLERKKTVASTDKTVTPVSVPAKSPLRTRGAQPLAIAAVLLAVIELILVCTLPVYDRVYDLNDPVIVELLRYDIYKQQPILFGIPLDGRGQDVPFLLGVVTAVALIGTAVVTQMQRKASVRKKAPLVLQATALGAVIGQVLISLNCSPFEESAYQIHEISVNAGSAVVIGLGALNLAVLLVRYFKLEKSRDTSVSRRPYLTVAAAMTAIEFVLMWCFSSYLPIHWTMYSILQSGFDLIYGVDILYIFTHLLPGLTSIVLLHGRLNKRCLSPRVSIGLSVVNTALVLLTGQMIQPLIGRTYPMAFVVFAAINIGAIVMIVLDRRQQKKMQ